MAYDPTRRWTPRERYAQLQADKDAAERAKSEEERLLEAWASYSDAELLAAIREGNQKPAQKELRKRVGRLRGVVPPETEAERQARAERAREMAQLGITETLEDEARISRRPRRR